MRRIVWPIVVAGVLMVGCVVSVLILPAWVRPGWLLPAMIVVIAAFGAVVFGAVAIGRTRPTRVTANDTTPNGFALAPRGAVIAIVLTIYIAALVAVIVTGQQVLAAVALGGSPARTSALSVEDLSCSRCSPVVVFTASGRTYRATLSGNIDDDLHPGVALVYDPSDPFRVMTLTDWRSGRHGAEPYVLVGVPIVAVLVTLGLWALGARRRRRFGTLRPSTAVRSIRGKGGRRRASRTWSIAFDDGTRASYLDSPRLRAALRDRVGAAHAAVTSSVTIGVDDRARLGMVDPYPMATSTAYSPFPYQPANPYPSAGYQPSYPPSGYGTHEAAPQPPRVPIKMIRLLSVGFVLVVAVLVAVVVGLQSHRSSSRGSELGSIGPGASDPANDDDCLDGPTAGPSPAATQYLDAVAAAMPEWMRVDATLASQNGTVYARDIAGEMTADATFLGRLQPITFPAGPPAVSGQQLVSAVRGYDNLIRAGESGNGYLSAHRSQESQLLAQRSDASGSLRQVLGLPPSQCTLLRP